MAGAHFANCEVHRMNRDFHPEEPELMDVPQPVTPELERDLANLASLNRYFGSHALIRRFLELWLETGHSYRILDFATGAGDIPRLIAQWARGRNVHVSIVAIDANPSTIEIARRHSEDFPEVEWICADAREYQARSGFDLVICSLALHHFSQTDATLVLRRCRELSHRFCLVADLERTWLAAAGIWLITELVYRDRMTRFDGRLSIRRAFSFSEFRALAEGAGWSEFNHARFPMFRQAIWMTSLEGGDIPAPVEELPHPLPCPV